MDVDQVTVTAGGIILGSGQKAFARASRCVESPFRRARTKFTSVPVEFTMVGMLMLVNSNFVRDTPESKPAPIEFRGREYIDQDRTEEARSH